MKIFLMLLCVVSGLVACASSSDVTTDSVATSSDVTTDNITASSDVTTDSVSGLTTHTLRATKTSRAEKALGRLDLESIEQITLPLCKLSLGNLPAVIDSRATLSQHYRCPDGVTPDFDFARFRIFAIGMNDDTRMLGVERREHDGALLIHTYTHYYRRGMPAQTLPYSFLIPPEGVVEQVRHILSEPERRGQHQYVP